MERDEKRKKRRIVGYKETFCRDERLKGNVKDFLLEQR